MKWPLPTAVVLVIDPSDRPKFVQHGRTKVEEFEIGWNLLEQHVRADLNFAATALAGARNGVISCFIGPAFWESRHATSWLEVYFWYTIDVSCANPPARFSPTRRSWRPV